MDAKSIYIACSHMRSKASWDKLDGNEWSYVGDQASFKERAVQLHVDTFFREHEIYLVVDRHRAFLVARKDAAIAVRENMTGHDVVLCDKAFRSMIVFSHIGVAKHGRVDS